MKKVITYGTFDLFHEGHYNIIKRAKEHGDYLIVGVTSESYDIERGKLSVQDSITKRIENVKATGLVDEVIIEEYLGQKIRDIIKYDIDTLVIGSDWIGKFDHLKKICEVVYLERTKNISSTLLREQSNKIFKMGIITENENDSDVVMESKYVSGINIQSVFSKDINIAKQFCEKYEIYHSYDDYESFVDSVDVVYIKVNLNDRYDSIKKALSSKKNVICDSPFTLDPEKGKELFDLAKRNNVSLIENITTLFLRAFTQLLWMAEGDIIGDTVSVKASCSYDNFINKTSLLDMTTLSSSIIIKMLGTDYNRINTKLVNDSEGKPSYANIIIDYKNAIGLIEIGNTISLTNSLVIVGTKGTITVADDWWDTGYFELKMDGDKRIKKYSFNFEGSGFRYIMQELLIMMRDNRSECTRIFPYESLGIIRILEDTGIEYI